MTVYPLTTRTLLLAGFAVGVLGLVIQMFIYQAVGTYGVSTISIGGREYAWWLTVVVRCLVGVPAGVVAFGKLFAWVLPRSWGDFPAFLGALFGAGLGRLISYGLLWTAALLLRSS